MTSMFSTVTFTLLVVLGILFLDTELYATLVDECDDEVFGETLDVTVSNCNSDCTLTKGTYPIVTIRFIPKSKVLHLKHRVSTKVFCVFGNCVWKGYSGIDETSADDKILLSGSKTRAKFPLEPNKEYVYNNSFHIKPNFPSMLTTVYAALKTPDDIVVACFLLDNIENINNNDDDNDEIYIY